MSYKIKNTEQLCNLFSSEDVGEEIKIYILPYVCVKTITSKGESYEVKIFSFHNLNNSITMFSCVSDCKDPIKDIKKSVMINSLGALDIETSWLENNLYFNVAFNKDNEVDKDKTVIAFINMGITESKSFLNSKIDKYVAEYKRLIKYDNRNKLLTKNLVYISKLRLVEAGFGGTYEVESNGEFYNYEVRDGIIFDNHILNSYKRENKDDLPLNLNMDRNSNSPYESKFYTELDQNFFLRFLPIMKKKYTFCLPNIN